jgi:hypothetical protein
MEANGKPVIVRLKKSLYDLKQAGELFYKLMKRILTSEETGMKCCCMHDMYVFTLFDDKTKDIIITDNSISIVERFISCIKNNIKKISNLGEITRYNGIHLSRDRINHTLELTQVPCTKSVIAKLGPNLKATSVPLNPYHDYRAKNEGEVNPPLYGELGNLRYLSDRKNKQEY